MPRPWPFAAPRGLACLLIAAALASLASQEVGAIGLCTQPVPRVAIALLKQAVNTPSLRARAVHTIDYLTRQYCIEYDTRLPTIDQSESIGNKCTMHTGLHLGERVYWADCPNDAEPFVITQPPPPPAPAPPAAPAPQQVDFWSLDDGSRMTLRADPDKPNRSFLFEVPSAAQATAGASRGSVFFEGTRRGLRYIGKAYSFARGCAPLAYDVAGTVTADPINVALGDQRQVTLQGKMPLRNATCQVMGFREVAMTLTFHDAQDRWGAN